MQVSVSVAGRPRTRQESLDDVPVVSVVLLFLGLASFIVRILQGNPRSSTPLQQTTPLGEREGLGFRVQGSQISQCRGSH